MEIRVPRVSLGQRWVCSAVWMPSYSAANVVFMSCSWVIALFQGDQGQRGVMGEPGPSGEKVRWCINIILSHRNLKKTPKHSLELGCTISTNWLHILLVCCPGWSRAKRNHRCSGSKGRACELSVMTNKGWCSLWGCKITPNTVLWFLDLLYQGLPGVDGREGIPGMPGAKVERRFLRSIDKTVKYSCSRWHSLKPRGYVAARSCISSSFSLRVCPQGGIGKAGAPGEIGPQGFPVSMTFDPKLSGLHVIGCTWVNSPVWTGWSPIAHEWGSTTRPHL